jgi:hypothetical protein
VLWCSLSAGSRWVIEEAGFGYELGRLIPVKIEPCELPIGFRRQDYIDLSPWDGSPRSHLLDPLMDALEQRCGPGGEVDLKGLREYEATWRRFGAPSLRAFALEKPMAAVEGERKMARYDQSRPAEATPLSESDGSTVSPLGRQRAQTGSALASPPHFKLIQTVAQATRAARK